MRRILIVGASSMIGTHLAVSLRKHHRVWGTYYRHRPGLEEVTVVSLPLTTGVPLRELTRAVRPSVAIYCLGIADEQQCAANPGQALIINSEGAEILAQEMSAIGGKVVFLSSSKVFAGDRGNYREDDATDGTSLYGSMKRQGEQRLAQHDNILILRLGNVFGLSQFPERTFLNRLLRDLQNQIALPLITDEFRTYYGVDQVCQALEKLLELDPFPTGIFHLGHGGKDSYYSFSLKVAGIFGLDHRRLRSIHGAEFSKQNQFTGARGNDLTLCGDEFAKRFNFQLLPPEASLQALKERLRDGRF